MPSDLVICVKEEEANVSYSHECQAPWFYLYSCGLGQNGSRIDLELAFKSRQTIVFSSPDDIHVHYAAYSRECLLRNGYVP